MKQVLVISKEPIFINENAELLLRAGLNVAESPNSQKAQRILGKDSFDVVIIDDRLLDLEMYKLCQNLRLTHQTSVVLIGTKPASEIQGDFKELGVDEYVEKPINIRNLIKQIASPVNLDVIEMQINSERAAEENSRLEQERQEQLKREQEQLKKDMEEKVKLEAERLEREQAEQLERITLEKEKLEQELHQNLMEREHLERDRQEQEQQEKLKREQENIEREKQEQIKLEKANLEQELQQLKLEKERLEQQQMEQQQQEKIKLEQYNIEKEVQEQIRLEKDRLEQELQQLKFEREHLVQERQEQEIQERLKLEQENIEKEKQKQIKLEKANLEQELQQLKLEKEQIEREQQEKLRLEHELQQVKLEKERLKQQLEQERQGQLKLEHEKAEKENLERELMQIKLERERMEQEKSGINNQGASAERRNLEQGTLNTERLQKELLQIQSEKERIEKEIQQIKLERERFNQTRVEKQNLEKESKIQSNLSQSPSSKPPTWEIIPTSKASPNESPNIALTAPPVSERHKKSNSIFESSEELSLSEQLSFNIWEDGKVAKLIDALITNRITEIKPVIDFAYKSGFSYPEIDALIETGEEETVKILNELAENKILVKKPFEKLYIAPDGNIQLVPVERCPRCDSSQLIKGQLIEHFYCGYVALDRDFKVDYKYECPKCHRDLRLIGTDYRNLGMHYRCQDCDEVFSTPIIKWRSLKNNQIWTLEELREIWVEAYDLNPDKKDWLEFQLKPKAQLIDFLKTRGYEVDEQAQISGSSGAVHTLDILAKRDDKLTEINLGIGILVATGNEAEVGLEALFKFDSRAYDIGINYKVIIAIPKLNAEAQKFADRQSINVLEAKSLATLVSDLIKQPVHTLPLPTLPINIRVARKEETSAPYSPKVTVRKQISEFLRKRGYEVFEIVKITGKSGAEHIFDIFAQKNDGVVVPRTVIRIIATGEGQIISTDEISQFDAEAFDTGIRNKAFIALPQLSVQGQQFARQQKIKLFQSSDMPNFNNGLT